MKKDEDEKRCPHCGYCPHCGRSDEPVKTVPFPVPYPYPVAPHPRPVYPRPYGPIWPNKPTIICGSTNIGVAPRENLAINATVMH